MSAPNTAPERWLAMMPPEMLHETLRGIFGVELKKQRWAIATDCRSMIAERTQGEFPPPAQDFAHILKRDGDTIGTISLRALAHFAGPAEWPFITECPSCNGTQELHELHMCDCIYCERAGTDITGTVPCEHCHDGTIVNEPKHRPAWIGPIAVNRVYLARACSAWTPPPKTWARPPKTTIALTAVQQTPGPCLRLDAGDVRVLLMALEPDRVPPRTPRLDMDTMR